MELGEANIHHTRLRLGMSPLKVPLFTHSLIPDPMCGCGLEAESTDHYILRCPAFGMASIEMYHTMVDILDISLLTCLKNDIYIVNLFLYGQKYMSNKRMN